MENPSWLEQCHTVEMELKDKGAIDYDQHGDPLCVLVWEAGSQEGQAVRLHPTRTGEYQFAKEGLHK